MAGGGGGRAPPGPSLLARGLWRLLGFGFPLLSHGGARKGAGRSGGGGGRGVEGLFS